jgi:hypothetical protein
VKRVMASPTETAPVATARQIFPARSAHDVM